MAEIQILTQRAEAPAFDTGKLAEWIDHVAARHDRHAGRLTYLFCDDAYILETNNEFLGHDYYTDIITFDYSNSRRIAGDMVISVDTVRSNARQLGLPYPDELCRVVIHGVLHLCGLGDKAPGEREVMRAHEDAALALRPEGLLTDEPLSGKSDATGL